MIYQNDPTNERKLSSELKITTKLLARSRARFRAGFRANRVEKIVMSIRALNPLPAGTIFVSNVAMMKTRPSSIAIKNEIFSPDFTGIKIAIIDTQPRISIGNTIVNVVCLYFRCGINKTTC